MIEFFVDCKLQSPNVQEHWSKKHRRNKKVYFLLCNQWRILYPKPTLPCEIELTRMSVREFDYDNLVFSFKAWRDIIASLLIPGLAPGRADADTRIKFRYGQEKSKKNTIRVRISNM